MEEQIGRLSDGELEELERQYSQRPRCRVCGERMNVSGTDEGILWACGPYQSDSGSGKDLILKPGRDRAGDEHYRQSRMVQRVKPDTLVVLAIQELRLRRKQQADANPSRSSSQ